MCRFVEYIGPIIPLRRLIEEPQHSLVIQSYRPREMRSGVVNADGFGVGWYQPEVEDTPGVFTSELPIWGDANLPQLGRKIHSGLAFAAVRSATPGMPYGQEHTQPFACGRYLFMHNGYITDFRRRLMRRLRDSLRDEYYNAISGGSDSEHVFALLLENLAESDDAPSAMQMAAAMRRTVRQLHEWTREIGLEALLNLALSDGRSIVTCRDSTTEYAPSLYVTGDEPFFPDAVVVASEPLFANGRWQEVPAGQIVIIEPDRTIRFDAVGV
jgi:ergothioneine biosynthesis protein EgtC